jgi:hypothetical protein
MTTNYLAGIFHWRDNAGNLDASHSPASMNTLLWGCKRWLEANVDKADTAEGRRLQQIKNELEQWLAHSNLGADGASNSLPEVFDASMGPAVGPNKVAPFALVASRRHLPSP